MARAAAAAVPACAADPLPLEPPPAVTTKVQRNKNMGKLQAGYLFPEVRHHPLLLLLRPGGVARLTVAPSPTPQASLLCMNTLAVATQLIHP